MSGQLTGLDLLLALRRMDVDQLRLPAALLLDELDQPLCEDCRQHHDSVFAAIVCDERIDARARRNAARLYRLGHLGLDPVDDDDLANVAEL